MFERCNFDLKRSIPHIKPNNHTLSPQFVSSIRPNPNFFEQMRIKHTPYRRFSSSCLPENKIKLSQNFIDQFHKKKMESSQQKWTEDLNLSIDEDWEPSGDELAIQDNLGMDSGFHSQEDLTFAPKKAPLLPRRDRLMNIVNMSTTDGNDLCPERTIDGCIPFIFIPALYFLLYCTVLYLYCYLLFS